VLIYDLLSLSAMMGEKKLQTRSLLTSYITPPQVRGIRKLVVAATNRNEPSQSKVLSLSRIDPPLGCNFRQMGMPKNPRAQKGMFNQKIHLHVAFSANTPPTSWGQYCLDRWSLELRQRFLSRILSRHIWEVDNGSLL
jgi:hypothetical protein